VDDVGVGRGAVEQLVPRPGAERLPDLPPAPGPECPRLGRRLRPVELDDVEPETHGRVEDAVAPGIDADADPGRAARRGEDRGRLGDRTAPAEARAQDDADVVRARVGREGGVLRAAEPADLDGRHTIRVTRSRRGRPTSAAAAAPGSGARMRCSPTRIASTPTPPRRSTASGVRIPLSPIRTRSAGTRPARSRETERSVWNVARSRLFTPISSAPAAR